MKTLIITNTEPYKKIAKRVNKILDALDSKFTDPVICLKTSEVPFDDDWNEFREAELEDDYDFYIYVIHGTHEELDEHLYNRWTERVEGLPDFQQHAVLATGDAVLSAEGYKEIMEFLLKS